MPALTKSVLPATAAAFDAALAAALAAHPHQAVFVLFTGAAAAPGGASWCPDCEVAKPLLARTLEEAGGAKPTTLLEVPLPRADYSGNAAHWARAHAGVKLERIPTLMRWGRAKKVAQLVEGDCADAAKVREFVIDWEE